ncbi:MAG TPA: hypothetical protein VGB13_09750 [Candidatus Krumholzibacteria bacterium]|jgi:hypothetical protein
MRKLLLISAVLAFSASAAFAVPTVGIYFDPGMANSDGTVEPLVENGTIYVILSDMNAAVAGVEYDLTLPAEVVVLGHNYVGGNGFVINGSPTSYAIGFANCELIGLGGGPATFIVDEITFLTLSEFSSSPVSLEACTACGDDIGVTSPRYAGCSNTVYNLTASNGTLSSQIVPVQSESWGAVKALFAN